METYTLHRGTAPLFVSLPHDGTRCRTIIAARMTPFGAARAGYRLACLAPVRVRARTRRVDHRAEVFALRRRSESSAGRYVAVSGAEHDRTVSARAVFRRAGLPAGTGTVAGRNRRARRTLLASVSRCAGRRDCADQGRCTARVVLWEGHSIRSVVPFLFDGRLPDFNLGTAGGASCSPACSSGSQPCLNRSSELRFRRQWPLQGRLHHAPLRRSGQWHRCGAAGDSRSATTWMKTRSRMLRRRRCEPCRR